jgi:hypothetical protein
MNANTQKIRFHPSLHHYQCGKQNIEEDLYHFPTMKFGVIELRGGKIRDPMWQKIDVWCR